MDILLELLKYTLPAVVTAATAYFLIKQYLDDRLRTEQLAQRREANRVTLPLRLQAYERLTLLCDRVSIPNVLLRIRMPDMSMGDLRGALLLAIRQEFEHNTSQQLYVSDTLWQIISLARDQALALVTHAGEGLDPQSPDDEYVNVLLQKLDEQGEPNALQRAIVAIRTEAGRLF
ncbi:MAG TPA: hypothetical protein PK971_02815 [Saprospiraceae bacterium]|nr:hypothetical protein [Saprospiraceae bacterium]